MKVNKSYTKRLRVTRNGKIVSRKAGQNHFNAKSKRRKQLGKRRTALVTTMTNKDKRRFLPGM